MKPSDQIETEAALWVVRLERGLTAAEQDEFLEWLTTDPRHGKELDRQSANWIGLNALADWRPEHASRPNRDLLAPQSRRVVWSKLRAPWLLAVAGMGLAAAAAVVTFSVFQPATPEVPVSTNTASFQQIASIERRTLDDGSVVELNRGSELKIFYTETERLVRLEKGEAMFTVAKDPGRPFIVVTDQVRIRAVGTAFNVRRSDNAIELIVTEGKVRVSPNTEYVTDASGMTSAPLVEAGQIAVMPLRPKADQIAVSTLESAHLDSKLAWHPRLLDFTNARLSSVIDEFNRRNAPIRIVIDHPALGDTDVSASLRSDNVESFIRLLEGGFGVQADRNGNVIILRQRR